MDFQTSFLKTLKTTTALTKSISLLDCFPKSIENPNTLGDNLPYIQAFGNLSCTYPYYYEISDFDSYCLLYTVNGCGTLTINNHNSQLNSGTLAFINCRELHRLEISEKSWDYLVFFINGNPIPYLHHTISAFGTVSSIHLNSAVSNMIHNLFNHLEKNDQNPFFYSKLILVILFDLILENERLSDRKSPIPNYLIQIRNSFEMNFHKNFSLDVLEQEYRISKYRICREFNKHFDTSPIQYLNRKRIAVAKETLIQTDKRINEIGHLIGFDNTNHFIRIFKQQTGVTPLEFRKQPPA